VSRDNLIAEAADLPLRDAAYAIWRQKITFERLEGRVWPRRDYSTPRQPRNPPAKARRSSNMSTISRGTGGASTA